MFNLIFNKMRKTSIFLSAALVAAVLFSACVGNPLVIVEVEDISLNRDTLALTLNQEFVLTAVVTPDNATNKSVEWSSTNFNIAKVNEGVVTALSLGKTTIIAKAGNKVATCVVSVASNPSVEEGVLINGLRWAKRNVGAFGTFVNNPEDIGMYYQWNRPTAWATDGVVTGWNSTEDAGTTWETANDPCPTGWRVPTKGELDGLASAATHTWTTEGGMNGMLFGNGSNTIFLPAAGCRNSSTGQLYNRGSNGYYWSSTVINTTNAYYLYFTSNTYTTYYANKSSGFSVRCVAE